MKYVVFEGIQYKVPVWVKFIARDLCGEVVGFENKPHKNEMCEIWDSDDGRFITLSDTGARWEDSLVEVG